MQRLAGALEPRRKEIRARQVHVHGHLSILGDAVLFGAEDALSRPLLGRSAAILSKTKVQRLMRVPCILQPLAPYDPAVKEDQDEEGRTKRDAAYIA
jgi:hypothetical protein